MAGNEDNISNIWNDCSKDELDKLVKEFDDMRFPPHEGPRRDMSLSECGGPVTQPKQDPNNKQACFHEPLFSRRH